MNGYRIWRKTHKWIGIIYSLVLLNFSITGLLLLEKKEYEWIQPATRVGAEGVEKDFIDMQNLMEVVYSHGHQDFQNLSDIDRIDFRPGKRVYKVRSQHNHSEIQVDAVTGKIMHVDRRMSDLLESLHDGSFFGDWIHSIFMPLVAIAVILLTLSGLYLWLVPVLRKPSRPANNPSG
jgi:uncharacterized iron-regulated membrane protein